MRRAVLLLVIAALGPSAPGAHAGLPSPPVEIWRWDGRVEDPARSWPTLAIAVPLQDRDGDGDADRDDGPDVAFLHGPVRSQLALTAVDGRTGRRLFTVDSPTFGSASVDDPTGSLAAADVDGDGFAELLVGSKEVSFPTPAPSQLMAFEHDGSFAWQRPWPASTAYSGQAMGIADLNADGVAEATLVGNVLSVDGSLSWSISETLPGWRDYTCFSQVADIDPDSPGLEMLYGANLYSATGAQLWGDWFNPMGPTGIGDLDGDGDAEIVLVSGNRVYFFDHRGVELQPFLTAPGSRPRGSRPSAPAVADIDGDGKDEVVVAVNVLLIAYEHDGSGLVEKWAVPVNDWTGICGPSAFDFDGDGAAELLYRDQDNWYVFEGADGAELHRERFPSRTGTESPIVFGLPGECGAVIVVTGFGDVESNDADAWDAVIAYRVDGASTPRGVWNQRTFHGTNVDDDGRLPLLEPAPWLEGAGWSAQLGSPVELGSLELGAVVASDLDSCNPGIEVSWDPAVSDDPSAIIVYDLHRSEAQPAPSCEDALAQPPIATDLASTSYLDDGAEPGVQLLYVVRARLAGGSSCAGPVEACGATVVEEYPPAPDGVFATLFLSHEGDEIRARWPSARGLLSGESFRLLKTVDDPTQVFASVAGLSPDGREHAETDPGSARQFFDLRVANGCERLSEDEYPADR